MKKINQFGVLSLHAVVPLVVVLVAIGGIGAYVVSKSSASRLNDGTTTCGTLKRDGAVYASSVGSDTKFHTAKDSDSIINLSVKLCQKGYLSKTEAHAIRESNGDSTQSLQSALNAFRKAELNLNGADALGAPGRLSITKLGLKPVGF